MLLSHLAETATAAPSWQMLCSHVVHEATAMLRDKAAGSEHLRVLVLAACKIFASTSLKMICAKYPK